MDRDSGYFLKSAPKGSLRREAELTRYFHGKGLSAASGGSLTFTTDGLGVFSAAGFTGTGTNSSGTRTSSSGSAVSESNPNTGGAFPGIAAVLALLGAAGAVVGHKRHKFSADNPAV